MAKFVPEKYYKMSTKEVLISSYHICIKKSMVEELGLQNEKDLNIYVKNGKIIIEKKRG